MIFYLIIFISTFFSIYHLINSNRFKNYRVFHRVSQKGISVLIPCYNEAPILKYTIKGIIDIEYDNLEVIFINDGSEDESFEILDELLDLFEIETSNIIYSSDKVKGIYRSRNYSFIYVVDKDNSGKANSLNTGILYSNKELIVTMDGDCVLEKNALVSMNTIFDDEDVVASGGIVHIMQMFKLESKVRRIVLMQALDYIKGFYIYKASLAHNDALSIISGAFGVFKKNVIVEVGGFRTGLGEDIDITLRVQEYANKNNKKVVFNRNAICYTECPESLKGLVRQRVRWQKGFIDAILNNSSFLLKNVFKSNVCFYMIIDALLSNSLATVVFIINLILMAAKVAYNYPLYIFVYYISTIIFNVICSVIAIRGAKKNTPNLKGKILYLTIIYDMAFFQFLKIFFFVKGTVTYYFDNTHWHKVERTNNSYKI